MDSARRLMSEKYFEQEGVRSCNGRRHGETCQNNNREQEKDDPEVGDLLQQPIFARMVRLLTEMADEIGPKQLQSKFTAPRRQVMAKVPAEKARDKIDKARYEQEPGRQKMRTASPPVFVKNIVSAGCAHLRTC